ncbi:MAG: HAD family hydrolase [Flavobacteriales bacterium MED-G22]|nr:MAG: HAD family hydrolase [Flavobacteriales bacterium MED-G22]|tara:strand:- start:595 stop:1209 length:615 start_codon:yes stop_codon:yes gene_type:complete
MDGTLVDNMAYHQQSWIEFFAFHQINMSYETFDSKYHKGSLIEIMARLFPTVNSKEELQKIGSYKEVLYRKLYHPNVKAIDGLIPFLKQLSKKGIPMGLATMGGQDNIDFIFESLQLHSYFHSTTGGHEVIKGKPHPDIFLTAARKLGVTPTDCLVFEDTHSGIESAKAAGMEVVGVSTMFDRKTLLNFGCIEVIQTYNELGIN